MTETVDWFTSARQESVGQLKRTRSVLGARQDGELIPANASDGVGLGQQGGEPLPERDQRAVAVLVTKALVDPLEPVDIDDEDCHGFRSRLASIEILEEQGSVPKSCQRIVKRLMQQLAPRDLAASCDQREVAGGGDMWRARRRCHVAHLSPQRELAHCRALRRQCKSLRRCARSWRALEPIGEVVRGELELRAARCWSSVDEIGDQFEDDLGWLVGGDPFEDVDLIGQELLGDHSVGDVATIDHETSDVGVVEPVVADGLQVPVVASSGREAHDRGSTDALARQGLGHRHRGRIGFIGVHEVEHVLAEHVVELVAKETHEGLVGIDEPARPRR